MEKININELNWKVMNLVLFYYYIVFFIFFTIQKYIAIFILEGLSLRNKINYLGVNVYLICEQVLIAKRINILYLFVLIIYNIFFAIMIQQNKINFNLQNQIFYWFQLLLICVIIYFIKYVN